MGENEDKAVASGSEPVRLDQEMILELNFVPSWARKPPAAPNYFRGSGAPSESAARPERKPRPPRDGRHPMGKRPVAPMPRRVAAPEPVQRAPVSVRFLPTSRALSAVVRQIHHTKKSYPLMELASLFLGRPESCEVKIEVLPDGAGQTLYQCARCRMVAMSRPTLVQHILRRHVDEFFVKEEKVGDPPTGQFVCVARCGRTGQLLGPPNHHSYTEKIQEIHRTLFSGMTLEEYQSRIERVHDPALIEQWKEESRKTVIYRRKGAPADAETFRFSAVSDLVTRELADSLITETRRATVPAPVAREMEDRSLSRAVMESWQKENRYPLSVAIALRGAFRHMHLNIFKAGGNMDFASTVKPAPLDPGSAIASIREVLEHLRAHPGCLRSDMVKALRGDAAPESPEVREVLGPLAWLIERGHIIEFFNGTLSVPLRGNGRRPEAARVPPPAPVQTEVP